MVIWVMKIFFIQFCVSLPSLLWEKFSISNNRASDKPHWLRYCHCAKLGVLSLPQSEDQELCFLHPSMRKEQPIYTGLGNFGKIPRTLTLELTRSKEKIQFQNEEVCVETQRAAPGEPWAHSGLNKSSFRFFCMMLWKNPNELFSQPNRKQEAIDEPHGL